jgi:hypothetical protein
MRYVVTVKWIRVAMSASFGFMFLLEIGAFYDHNGTRGGELIFTSAFLAVIAWLTYRSARSATLIADDDSVVVRTLIRTRRWDWSDIEQFITEIRFVGVQRRLIVGIRRRGGRICWFDEIGGRPGKSAGLRLEAAVAELNQRLAAPQLTGTRLGRAERRRRRRRELGVVRLGVQLLGRRGLQRRLHPPAGFVVVSRA